MPKIDAKNDRFGLPKASQNDLKIGPKNYKKSMQKKKRKKNQHKTKMAPAETQKVLKNHRKPDPAVNGKRCILTLSLFLLFAFRVLSAFQTEAAF